MSTTSEGWRTRWRVLGAALLGSAMAAGALYLAAYLRDGASGLDDWWLASVIAVALSGSLTAALFVRRRIDGRLRQLVAQLDGREDDRDLLARLPDLGDDEVGRIAAAFNRLLARLTRMQGEAIDLDRELSSTQRALTLAEALAEKSAELEDRLRERGLLFEVLRESAEGHDPDRILTSIAERTHRAMQLRELVIALKDDAGVYTTAACVGLRKEDWKGHRIERPVSGPFATGAGVLMVPDVSRAPVRAFDALPEEGSLAIVPLVHRGEELGVFIATRPPEAPLEELTARFLEAVADQTGLALHNARLRGRLEAMATHDELTGLPNRRLLNQRLARALERADRYGHPVSVLALDLDHFKQLNDREGHAAGDVALKEVAHVLRAGLRSVDLPARTGGEELVVLLADTNPEGAAEVADKLRKGIAALRVPGAEAQPLGYLSVSVGVATRRAEETGDALLARADAALYAAKNGGRDRVERAE
ncbi:MAG: diguanylate cyclase [Sandaracinaceae bacterium]